MKKKRPSPNKKNPYKKNKSCFLWHILSSRLRVVVISFSNML
jgi:hypothetical protein